MPNWDNLWPDWLAQIELQLLEPMKEDVTRELVSNYCKAQRGDEPDPTQVTTIIRFAQGLPIAVTTAARLKMKYGVKDFEEVEAGALDEVIKRLCKGVPSQMVPILRVAAVVRYFNKEILRAILRTALEPTDINADWDDLRCFPFVMPSRESSRPVWRLHGIVREFIDRDLQVQERAEHRRLHERAASYFEEQLKMATGEEAEQLKRELLYHRIHSG